MEHNETRGEDHAALVESALHAVFGGLGVPTSFLVMIGGHTDATWAPRTYAVQSDLSGGVTGGQASFYEWRRP